MACHALDGPALRADGVVLDLDGDAATFFSHAKELSPSHEAKSSLKDNARMLNAMKVAHLACEGEIRIARDEACSVDSSGIVHGARAMVPPSPDNGSARAKLFHHKKLSRQGTTPETTPKSLVTGDPLVPPSFFLDDSQPEFQRQCSLDSNGVLHEPDEDADAHPCASSKAFANKVRMEKCRGQMQMPNIVTDVDHHKMVQSCREGHSPHLPAPFVPNVVDAN
eukprot:gnl/TRDRNA2_/TRDRNA2_190821_c0_seq1.p1 gnl/TRDRNA2_/TRDRNA2_190821_c0~~gnl/TRDRNA2_/TRDRNA2_190821_c0_seq1.p1  ORF type:complete len:223 (-),score=38.25 gnl/TRDRNA2_/TRDRNA2_190821_c0_seq1:226-894(-)